jgi:hypothetical protein
VISSSALHSHSDHLLSPRLSRPPQTNTFVEQFFFLFRFFLPRFHSYAFVMLRRFYSLSLSNEVSAPFLCQTTPAPSSPIQRPTRLSLATNNGPLNSVPNAVALFLTRWIPLFLFQMAERRTTNSRTLDGMTTTACSLFTYNLWNRLPQVPFYARNRVILTLAP